LIASTYKYKFDWTFSILSLIVKIILSIILKSGEELVAYTWTVAN
jgi:hypothetical protein